MQISLLGDLHLGNQAAKTGAFQGALWRADKIILMGDLIEGITKKDIRHSKDSIMDYSEQITTLIKILKPYKDKILMYVEGNHEETLHSRSDIDTVGLVCGTLGIRSCYTEILEIDGCSIFLTHGSGSPQTYQGAVAKVLSYAKDHTADYYFIGHTHKLFDVTIQHDPKPYTIINTGSFLGQPEYARKRAYPKPIIGYYTLDTITKKLTKIEWNDSK